MNPNNNFVAPVYHPVRGIITQVPEISVVSDSCLSKQSIQFLDMLLDILFAGPTAKTNSRYCFDLVRLSCTLLLFGAGRSSIL